MKLSENFTLEDYDFRVIDFINMFRFNKNNEI